MNIRTIIRNLKDWDINSAEYRDAHELAHAHDIGKRFTDKEVTNGRFYFFLDRRINPRPAAITGDVDFVSRSKPRAGRNAGGEF